MHILQTSHGRRKRGKEEEWGRREGIEGMLRNGKGRERKEKKVRRGWEDWEKRDEGAEEEARFVSYHICRVCYSVSYPLSKIMEA